MSKARKILIICSCIVVILILAGVLFVKFVNSPSNGVVSNNLKPLPSSSPSFNFTPIKVTGKYITFSYPSSMSEVNGDNNSGAILESYVYKYTDTPQSWLLAIDVNGISQPSLNYDSSYSLRLLKPNEYKQSIITYGNNTFYVMNDTYASGFAEVAFTLKGNKTTDISLMGDDISGTSKLNTTFNTVLKSFQWK